MVGVAIGDGRRGHYGRGQGFRGTCMCSHMNGVYGVSLDNSNLKPLSSTQGKEAKE